MDKSSETCYGVESPAREIVMQTSYEQREAEVEKRHLDNVFASSVRKKVAGRLKCQFQIPEERGFVQKGFEDFDEIAGIVTEGRSRISALQDLSRKVAGFRGWDRTRKVALSLLEECDEDTIFRSPLFQLALNPVLVSAVAEYFGYVPVLAMADYWFNPNVTTDYRGKGNQGDSSLYHLDWADNRIVKVFVHCNDVSPENGPLCLLPARASERIRKRMNPQYERRLNTSPDLHASNGLYLSDRHVVADLREGENVEPLVGPAGTVFIADTSRCFHYGGRNSEPGNERLIAVLQFLRPGAPKLNSHFEALPFAHLVHDSIPELQRLVLGASG